MEFFPFYLFIFSFFFLFRRFVWGFLFFYFWVGGGEIFLASFPYMGWKQERNK